MIFAGCGATGIKPAHIHKSGNDALDNLLDKELTQTDCNKMRPDYWEKTWWRRLYVRVKWWRDCRRAEQAQRAWVEWQLTWYPEEWDAWIINGELPTRNRPARFRKP